MKSLQLQPLPLLWRACASFILKRCRDECEPLETAQWLSARRMCAFLAAAPVLRGATRISASEWSDVFGPSLPYPHLLGSNDDGGTSTLADLRAKCVISRQTKGCAAVRRPLFEGLNQIVALIQLITPESHHQIPLLLIVAAD